ncbi:MAG: DUF1499 domain-containing protein [Myxococcota bacterium]|nr:DUF1499 domain-containing protein [Myxococcota bacterium]
MASERSGLATAGYFCGIGGIACLVIGIGGIQIRLFPPMLGFGLFAVGTIAGGVTATLLGTLALIRKKNLTGPSDLRRAQTGTALGVVLLILLFLSAGTGGDAPPINDITTNLANPPAFASEQEVPAYRGRDMSYPPEFVKVVKRHYPDLYSAMLPVSPDEAYARALATAKAMGLDIVWQSPSERRFDATDTTPVFRFVDDVTVRVLPAGSSAVIDVRSKSRDGQGDLGTNAKRIQACLSRVKAS